MPTTALNHLGAVPAATRARAAEILAAVEAAGHRIHHVWGMGSSSEHASGRALDFMVYIRNTAGVATGIDSAAGDFIRDYVWTHRERLGLIHVLWEQHITSTRTASGVRRLMADRGSPTENHMDHPHLFFDDSPYVAPRAEQAASRDEPRQPVTTPKPAPAPDPAAAKPAPQEGLDVKLIDLRNAHRTLVRGAGVKPMQRLLGIRADGLGGKDTRAALGAAQKRAGLRVDYMFGPDTAEALLAGK